MSMPYPMPTKLYSAGAAIRLMALQPSQCHQQSGGFWIGGLSRALLVNVKEVWWIQSCLHPIVLLNHSIFFTYQFHSTNSIIIEACYENFFIFFLGCHSGLRPWKALGSMCGPFFPPVSDTPRLGSSETGLLLQTHYMWMRRKDTLTSHLNALDESECIFLSEW